MSPEKQEGSDIDWLLACTPTQCICWVLGRAKEEVTGAPLHVRGGPGSSWPHVLSLQFVLRRDRAPMRCYVCEGTFLSLCTELPMATVNVMNRSHCVKAILCET
jgi:hypothetical protein